MKIKNSTDFPSHFLRRMIGWICREIGLPAKSLRHAQYTFCRHLYRGRAWSSRRILVRIHRPEDFPNVWPRITSYPGLVTATKFEIRDRLEALLKVTAHELAHIYQYVHGHKSREVQTDRTAFAVVEVFRLKRAELEAAWSKPVAERAKTPTKSPVEQRHNKAIADLERWERKFKLAKTKVRKHKARVRYYEQRQAASKGQS